MTKTSRHSWWGRRTDRAARDNRKREEHSAQFQLRPANKKRSQLEWQFGTENNDLFQLRTAANAPTDGLTLESTTTEDRSATIETHGHRRRGTPLQGSRAAMEWARWRKPSVEPIPSVPSLQGEIVTDTDTQQPNASDSHNPFAPVDRSSINPSVAAVHNRALQADLQTGGQAVNVSGKHSNLVRLFSDEAGLQRVLATQIALDEAIDRWWTNGELASLALLRDGLLILEAGHNLDETQRSFLLRNALRTQRGMITALRYQLDADRTAFLLKEALLDTKYTFDPALIDPLRAEDEQSEEWADYLEHDLAYEATVATGKRSQLAAKALAVMQQQIVKDDLLIPVDLAKYALPLPIAAGNAPWTTTAPLLPLSHRWSLRWLLWGVLVFALLLAYGQPQLVRSAPVVAIPAGSYLISDPASSNPAASGRFRTVTLPAYRIDRHEVTNMAYRHCWEQQACPIPASFDSADRPGYFINRSYDNFPVVNVNWNAANTYCRWVGKRLPTLDEWEVAASLAPATGLRYIYPWGDRFDLRVVNSARVDPQDTQPVGSYHPAGSTPLGIMDLAGNVAEWTAMPTASMVDGFVVKGGSFLDKPEQLRNDAFIEVQRDSSEPWLGFRCAVDE